MFRSVFLSFSFKYPSRLAINPLRRFDPSHRVQCCNYAKYSKYRNEKQAVQTVYSFETQASRPWTTYALPGVVALGFAGLATFIHYNDERRAIAKGQENSSDRCIAKGPSIGGPFTLTDTKNGIVTEKTFRGNWILLYFGYTSSPDVGPEQLQVIAKSIDNLELKYQINVIPIFVTIDPQRDNPSHLGAYLKEFDRRIVGLTGPVVAIRQMAQEYRVYFKKVEEEGRDYLVESSHNMYLLNPNMEVVRCFGVEYNAEELSQTILNEVKKAMINELNRASK